LCFGVKIEILIPSKIEQNKEIARNNFFTRRSGSLL